MWRKRKVKGNAEKPKARRGDDIIFFFISEPYLIYIVGSKDETTAEVLMVLSRAMHTRSCRPMAMTVDVAHVL